jgi:hypothetical protein
LLYIPKRERAYIGRGTYAFWKEEKGFDQPSSGGARKRYTAAAVALIVFGFTADPSQIESTCATPVKAAGPH